MLVFLVCLRYNFPLILAKNKHFMSFRLRLGLIVALSASSWVAWLLILFNVDPRAARGVLFLGFYLSLYLALLMTFWLLGFFLRLLRQPEVIFPHMRISFRQALLLASLILSLLVLRGNRLLEWWSTLLLVLFVISLETFFTLQKRERRPKRTLI